MSCSGPPMSGGFIPDEDLPQGGRKVTAKRILDVGARGKFHGPGIGDLKEGDLSKIGYSVKKGKTARHKAIRKAVKKYGALSTFRKLQAVSTYTKRTSKGKSRTYKADRNWVRKMFM